MIEYDVQCFDCQSEGDFNVHASVQNNYTELLITIRLLVLTMHLTIMFIS